MKRFTVLSAIAGVALVGLGLAAMRDGSELALELVLFVFSLTLPLSVLGAIVRRGSPGWTGLAVFLWFYTLAVLFLPEVKVNFDFASRTPVYLLYKGKARIDASLSKFVDHIYRLPPPPAPLDPPLFGSMSDGRVRKLVDNHDVPLTDTEQVFADTWEIERDNYIMTFKRSTGRRRNASDIAHMILAVLFGIVGSLTGRLIANRNPRIS